MRCNVLSQLSLQSGDAQGVWELHLRRQLCSPTIQDWNLLGLNEQAGEEAGG